MNADTALQQRITRLTRLDDVLAAMARIAPVDPVRLTLADATGCVLATDLPAPEESRPPVPVALSDGWAVNADLTRDAGPYAPFALPALPPRVDVFQPLPVGTDAVAPFDAVATIGGTVQMMAPVAPGEGVLAAGGDAAAGALLCPAGSQLGSVQLAALTAMGIENAIVRRPRCRLVNTKPGDAVLDAAVAFLAKALSGSGAQPKIGADLDAALRLVGDDAIIAVGGTGEGRGDRSVIALSRGGDVICHGVGLSPGAAVAFGTSKGRPVLLMPGRIDAVLACWLTLGLPLVHRLSGAQVNEAALSATLVRKVTSTIGLTEIVLLRRSGDGVEPMASAYLPLQSLACAHGWMLVPAESEGYPAGTEVKMRLLP